MYMYQQPEVQPMIANDPLPDLYAAMAKAEQQRQVGLENQIKQEAIKKAQKERAAEEAFAKMWAERKPNDSVSSALPQMRDIFASQGLLDKALQAEQYMSYGANNASKDKRQALSTAMSLMKIDPRLAEEFAARQGLDLGGIGSRPQYKIQGNMVYQVDPNTGMPRPVADYRKGNSGNDEGKHLINEMRRMAIMQKIEENYDKPELQKRFAIEAGMQGDYPELFQPPLPVAQKQGWGDWLKDKVGGGLNAISGSNQTAPTQPLESMQPMGQIPKAGMKLGAPRTGHMWMLDLNTGKPVEVKK